MTLIELLDLISQGIEPPRRIEYEGNEFIYKEEDNLKDYYCGNDYYMWLSDFITCSKEDLNKVVIIKENKVGI